jgi:hypothetical protein
MKKLIWLLPLSLTSCLQWKQTVYPEHRITDATVTTTFISTLTKTSGSEISLNELLTFARMIHGNEVTIENIRRESKGKRLYSYTFDVVSKK